MLLLVPAIPALQDNTFFENESVVLDGEKFPIIFQIILKWFYSRQYRIDLIADISFDRYLIDENRNLWEYDIYHPILFIRWVMLILSTVFISHYIQELSDNQGWNWDIPLL